MGKVQKACEVAVWYLLHRSELDGLRVVVVVDDVEVFNWSREGDVERCFSRSFGQNGEVSGLPALQT